MALINCPECNREISDKAIHCVHCGCPLEPAINIEVPSTSANTLQRRNPYKKAFNLIANIKYLNKKKRPKIILSITALIVIISLIVCRPFLYHIALKQYENESFKNASSLFSIVRNYSDAQYYYNECQMHIYADYAFLDAIEESILKIQELKKDNSEEKAIIKTELSYLEGFYTKKFYNSALQTYSRDYIEALNLQQDSIDSKYNNSTVSIDSTIRYYVGEVKKYVVLNKLYYDYNILAHNSEFIATYVDEVDSIELKLEAYQSIKKDIDKQIQEMRSVNHSGNTSYISIKNNTSYTFNIFVKLDFYNSQKNHIGEDFGTAYNISPNKKVTVKIPCPYSWDTCRISWDANGVNIGN